jgi:hypothetical protein
MARLGKLDSIWGWGFLLWIPLAAPVLGHTVKVSGDVAATFHIEPNHNPKAGQPSLAWFALTQRGGKVIPLTQCHCTLKVHLNPHKEDDAPTIEPLLKPVSIAQYQNVPGADITFPKPGEYELEMSGTPQEGAKFRPFELNYEVTVMAGPTASEAITQPKPSTQRGNTTPQNIAEVQPASESLLPKVMIAGLSVAALTAIGYVLRRKK